MAIFGDTSTVSEDDGDWVHSDYSHADDNEDEDEDEEHRQPELGVGGSDPSRRNGEFPPRVLRWLRMKLLHHLLMTRREMEATMKCVHRWHDEDDSHDSVGKITAVRAAQPASSQIRDSPSRRSEKRKRNDIEAGTVTEMTIVRSESYNCNSNDNDDLDESTSRKRQRLKSLVCRAEGLGGLPANTDGAREVAAPPITIPGRLSEASALLVEPRRSQRIQEKLGSACIATRRS